MGRTVWSDYKFNTRSRTFFPVFSRISSKSSVARAPNNWHCLLLKLQIKIKIQKIPTRFFLRFFLFLEISSSLSSSSSLIVVFFLTDELWTIKSRLTDHLETNRELLVHFFFATFLFNFICGNFFIIRYTHLNMISNVHHLIWEKNLNIYEWCHGASRNVMCFNFKMR